LVINNVTNAFTALLVASLLQFATNVIAKFKPKYSTEYYTLFICALSLNLLGFVFGLVVSAIGSEMTQVDKCILMILRFALLSWIIGVGLKYPNTGIAIGSKRGALISLIWIVVVGLLSIVAAVALSVLASFLFSNFRFPN
jgi:hypothetical protein